MTWTTRLLQGLLAVAFIGFGFLKLFAHPLQVDAFTGTYGYSVSFMYLVGAVELAAGAGLVLGFWQPRVALFAVGVIALIMAGAMMTHVRSAASMRTSVPPLIFLAMALWVIAAGYRRRARAR
ncbi:DoxX family protein [Paenibacillus whitsoniae]|uniref:DoxX family protein n=1 Tax=Paenibacillus whitsoniae TaxID=2496558 RepID=UPI0013DFB9BD|nr:DoxX family protein [Paenibacillus whitsoniae]